MSNNPSSNHVLNQSQLTPCPKIIQLLQHSVDIVSSSFSIDHVLVLELDSETSDQYSFASMGWNRQDSLRLAKQMINWALKTTSDEINILVDNIDSQGEIYTLSSTFLTQINLVFGVFITVPCREGSLLMLAGRSGTELVPGHPEAIILHSLMKILGLALVSTHAEQLIQRDLKQLIDVQDQREISIAVRPHLMCLLDDDGHVLQINNAFEQWDLGDDSSIRGKHVHRILHPDCVEANCNLLNDWNAQWLQLADTEVVACDFQDQVLEFDLYCFLIKCRQYPDRRNTEAYALLIMEDVSVQKSAELLLDNYNDKLQEMHAQPLDTSLPGYCVVRNDLPIYCNNRFAEIFDFRSDEICKQDMHQLIRCERPEATSGLNGVIHEKYWMSDEQIVKVVSRKGKSLWLLRSMTTVDCLDELTTLIKVVEVQPQKDAWQTQRASKGEFQLLSKILIKSQEEERKRISRELHDSVGQKISAIKLSVEIALQECEPMMPDSSINYLTSAIEVLSATMDDVRRISMNLRPSILDDIGLIATIGWFCREFRPLIPEVELTVHINVIESDIPELLKIVVFRILQEALNNIGKHAFASKVRVELSKEGDLLTFHVEDDGCGFVTEAISVDQGFGLGNMRQRAKHSGGILVVEPRINGGTVIHATWRCSLL